MSFPSAYLTFTDKPEQTASQALRESLYLSEVFILITSSSFCPGLEDMRWEEQCAVLHRPRSPTVKIKEREEVTVAETV